MQEPLIFKKIDTPELLAQAHKLRFQVYCKECNFIDATEHPDGYESDKYDASAIHFAALDTADRLVGAVRLILPSCDKLPIEEKVPAFSFKNLGIDRSECAEISRLSISKTNRNQAELQPTHFIMQVSSIALGLCYEMHNECRRVGINYCVALMEKSLWMLLRIHGFVFNPIGPEIDFFGKVVPYLIDVRDLEKRGLFKISHGRAVRIQEDQFS